MALNRISPVVFAIVLFFLAESATFGSAQDPETECVVFLKDNRETIKEHCLYEGTSITCNQTSIRTVPNIGACSAYIPGKICIKNIRFDIFRAHQPPVKKLSVCALASITLTVNVNDHATDATSIWDTTGITTLRLIGNNRADNLHRLQHIGKITSDMTVKSLIIEKIGEPDKSPEPGRLTMSFSTLKSFHMSDSQLSSLPKGAISFLNLENLDLNDLNVLHDAAQEAIVLRFAPPCPSELVTLNLRNIRVKTPGDGIVKIENQCQGSNLNISISAREIEPVGVLTERMFRGLLVSPMETGTIGFSSDPVKCCAEESAWLFMPNVISNKRITLDVQCSDLGGPLRNYNETSRVEACKQQVSTTTSSPTTAPPSSNVPVQLIVIGFIACLILILLAVFIYLRITPSPRERVKLRSQPGSPPQRPKEPISIPSNSLPSESKSDTQKTTSIMAKSAKSARSPKSPKSAKSLKGVKSTKSTKSNWSTKGIGKGRRASQMNSPSAIRSKRSL